EPPLYAARRKVYPQRVSGTYRRVKWIVLCVTLGVYYLLPFVRWDRAPNAPSQAVLIDFPSRRFYFFFIEIWPQEFYYLTGLLILAAMALFLMNAIAGRLWCGTCARRRFGPICSRPSSAGPKATGASICSAIVSPGRSSASRAPAPSISSG